MREMRMTGSKEEELKRGINFILNNQEYLREVKEITHIVRIKNALYAFSFHERYIKEYKPEGELPIPVDIEAFSSMAALWWNKQEEPMYDCYNDGDSAKGFIISSGKDWGSIDPSNDFGNNTCHPQEDSEDSVKMINVALITIIVNQEIWGK